MKEVVNDLAMLCREVFPIVAISVGESGERLSCRVRNSASASLFSHHTNSGARGQLATVASSLEQCRRHHRVLRNPLAVLVEQAELEATGPLTSVACTLAKLSRRQQAVLREIYQWREQRAAAADRLPFKIVGPEVLLALAEIEAPTIEDVEDAFASYPRQAREVDIVFEAIVRGLELLEAELPRRESGPSHPPMSAAARKRTEALRGWRTAQAARSKLDPSIVMSQRVLDRLALAGPRSLAELAAVEGIRGWRVTEWGAALLAACA